MMSHMAQVSRRVYSTGFMISQYFFAIGGLSINGECLDDILMMDTHNKVCRAVTRENNKTLKHLRPLCSSACIPAFYSSRYSHEGVSLSLDKVSQEIDWSTALSMIKFEGIYHFGGRDDRSFASNRLICIQIAKNAQTTQGALAGEPQLSIVKLEPKG